MTAGLSARALPGLGEVAPGADLAELIVDCAERADEALDDGLIVVIAHKVVSKAEGRVFALRELDPSPRALTLAREHGKDPRAVELVLRESEELVRAERGVLIALTRHGFVCANAGVDASNAAEGTLIALPVDPDASARRLRARLRELTGASPAVLITDSFGRAWRVGQCDVAVGAAGLEPLDDWRGRTDASGRTLLASVLAVADQIAGLADLARAKDSREPVVLIRGLDRRVTAADGPGASALIRSAERDLFR